VSTLAELQTIADSKRAFHTAFPFVIPPLYRRMADELLVELHLLSHQKQFQVDALFAVGLRQVFQAFTRGYKPEHHLPSLYQALCSSTGFDGAALEALAEQSKAAVSGHSIDEVRGWLEQGGEGAPETLASVLKRADTTNFHYSRLMAVGLLSLLSEAQGDQADPEQLRKLAHELSGPLGLARTRVEKDLGLYASNLDRMAQAVELMEETLAAERRKRERQQQDATNPTT
jgi:photosystem II biogenesis protein Psp29